MHGNLLKNKKQNIISTPCTKSQILPGWVILDAPDVYDN